MSDTSRIIIFGGNQPTKDSGAKLITIPWDALNERLELGDGDKVIIDLLSLDKIDDVDWVVFHNIINSKSMKSLITSGGSIIILGDPRFAMKMSIGPHVSRPDFLGFTGISFDWEEGEGEPVVAAEDMDASNPLSTYLGFLNYWHYALTGCKTPNPSGFVTAWTPEKVKLTKRTIARTRTGADIAFELNFEPSKVVRKVNPNIKEAEEEETIEYGSILFLPRIDLSPPETISLVTRTLCDLAFLTEEPEWAASMPVPGQKEIQNKMMQIERQIAELENTLEAARPMLKSKRAFLRLLYDCGTSLDEVVRNVFTVLGANVTAPVDDNGESGWISVDVGGDQMEGVLEIKSTEEPQCKEEDLHRLSQWVSKGIREQQKRFKGIYISSNSTDKPPKERPNPFDMTFAEISKLHQFVVITTPVLWELYVLKCARKLDLELFWNRLFLTDGLFDIKPLRPKVKPAATPSTKKESKPTPA